MKPYFHLRLVSILRFGTTPRDFFCWDAESQPWGHYKVPHGHKNWTNHCWDHLYQRNCLSRHPLTADTSVVGDSGSAAAGAVVVVDYFWSITIGPPLQALLIIAVFCSAADLVPLLSFTLLRTIREMKKQVVNRSEPRKSCGSLYSRSLT